MKKIILTMAAVFALTFANAQDKKEKSTGEGFSNGDVFISGAIGYSSEKTGSFKASGLEFSPRVGYFVSDNIALGLALGFASQKVEQGGSATNTQTSFGVFGRYYATPSSKFSLFAQLGFDVTSSKNEWYVDSNGNLQPTDSKDKGFKLAFAPGFHYFLSDKFALETSIAALSYGTSKFDGASDSTDTFKLGIDFSKIMFGLTYKF